MDSKRFFISVGLIGILIAVLSIVITPRLIGGSNTIPDTNTESIQIEDAFFEATYAKRYSSLNELADESIAIVRGIVVSEETPGYKYGGGGVVLSEIEFRVEKLYFGSDRFQPGSVITIGQTGGIIGNTRYQLEYEPLMTKGQEFVFFLTPWGNQFPNKLYTVGSYSGRFLVKDGIVSRTAPQEELSSFWTGKRVEDLEEAIEGLSD